MDANRKLIPALYQYARNDGHSSCTEESCKCSHHSCVMISAEYTTVVSLKQDGNTFSQPMYRAMGDPPLVHGVRCRDQSSSYPRQIQDFGILPLEIGQTYQKRIGLGSIDCEFHILNAQLSQCGPVCDAIQSQNPIYFMHL